MTAAYREVVAHSHTLEQNAFIAFILSLSTYIIMWQRMYSMFATTNYEFNCLLKLYFRGQYAMWMTAVSIYLSK